MPKPNREKPTRPTKDPSKPFNPAQVLKTQAELVEDMKTQAQERFESYEKVISVNRC